LKHSLPDTNVVARMDPRRNSKSDDFLGDSTAMLQVDGIFVRPVGQAARGCDRTSNGETGLIRIKTSLLHFAKNIERRIRRDLGIDIGLLRNFALHAPRNCFFELAGAEARRSDLADQRY